MTQRKYREVTKDDIGKMIEVTDDRPTSKNVIWHSRKLRGIDSRLVFHFGTYPTERWLYARIEVTDDPT